MPSELTGQVSNCTASSSAGNHICAILITMYFSFVLYSRLWLVTVRELNGHIHSVMNHMYMMCVKHRVSLTYSFKECANSAIEIHLSIGDSSFRMERHSLLKVSLFSNVFMSGVRGGSGPASIPNPLHFIRKSSPGVPLLPHTFSPAS
jgi:hypothetical protein